MTASVTQYGLRIPHLGEQVFVCVGRHEAESIARLHDGAEILQRTAIYTEWEPVAP